MSGITPDHAAERLFAVVVPQPKIEDVREAVTAQSEKAMAEAYAVGLIEAEDWQTPEPALT